MNEEFDSFVIKRDYSKTKSYLYGDLVEYNGNSFIALKDGSLSFPDNNDKEWYRLNSRSNLYRSLYEPRGAAIGDKWFDAEAGTLYTRIEQTDGTRFWIEL